MCSEYVGKKKPKADLPGQEMIALGQVKWKFVSELEKWK